MCHQTLKSIYTAIEKERPKIVIQIGDLYDLFSFSRFPKRLDVIGPEQELIEARRTAEAMWHKITTIDPKIKCYQILGNHCVRPKKLVLEKCPELYPLVVRSWQDMFRFKGVETLYDDRDDLELDGVIYEHGFYSRPGLHLRENMKSTVFGHTHRPWIHYEKIRKQTLFELNVGYAANPESPALAYSRKKWGKSVRGHGLIDEQGPRFIPCEP